MKDTLQEISTIAVKKNTSGLSDEHKKLFWLGNAPVTEEEIKFVEKKLGLVLPSDYKELLLTTNGFFTPCDSTEPTFEKVNDIDHLKNIDPFLLEVWNEDALADIGKQLNRAIVVAGINDEQYFLLIPPHDKTPEWQYWKFANWIPGVETYDNLAAYFESVLDFLND